MRQLVPLLLLALLGLLLTLRGACPAAAEEERTGVECGLYALVDLEDAGALAIYDGLRKGLELAQMPRVCREDLEPTAGALNAFLEGLPARHAKPVFAIGDQASRRLAEARTRAARVLAVERYTIRGRPLHALPQADGASVVYAALPVRRVGRVVRSLGGATATHVDLALADEKQSPETRKALAAFLKAAGLEQTESSSPTKAEAEPRPAALLHLRLGVGEKQLSFAAALKRARALKRPLISDDRARFGQGALVTLVARHELLGRATAETALRRRRDPTAKLLPRVVSGIEIWVDLAAADAQGLTVPLPFIARADKLKRGARRTRPVKKAGPR